MARSRPTLVSISEFPDLTPKQKRDGWYAYAIGVFLSLCAAAAFAEWALSA